MDHDDGEVKSRERSNSTSSIRTIENVQECTRLDIGERFWTPSRNLLNCIALLLHYQMIQDSMAHPTVTLDYLEEQSYTGVPVHKRPTADDISAFLTHVFTLGEFDRQPHEFLSVILLIYVNRVLASSGIHLTAGNWKTLLIGSLCIAQKFHDDKPLINQDFCLLYPVLKPPEIGLVERKLLGLLKWKMMVSWPRFCQYYFELRSVWLEQSVKAQRSSARSAPTPLQTELVLYTRNKAQFRKQTMTWEDVATMPFLSRARIVMS